MSTEQELRMEDITDVFERNDKTQKNELDDLLGSDDDDDDDDEDETNGHNSVEKNIATNGNESNHHYSTNKNELDDLLGNDDDDDVDKSSPSPSKHLKQDELDQLLGDFSNENDHSLIDEKDKNVKIHSNLLLHKSLRIPKSQQRFFVRTPNFIKIHQTVYDSNRYDEEAEKTIYDGSAAILRHRIKKDEYGSPVIGPNGLPIHESNGRLVKYDDGTYQLIVGKAVFNSKLVTATGCYIFQEQRVINDDPNDGEDVVDSSCLECIGAAENRMILQPSSLDSETHTRMSLKISERFKKDNKISIHDYEKIVEKPEVTLALLAKKEEEQIRKEMKQRNQYAELRNTNGNDSRYYQQSRPSMSTSYLNDESQFDGENISDLKGKFKRNKNKIKKSKDRYNDEEDLDDFLDEDEDEEEDEEGDIDGLINDESEEEEEEEEEEVVKKKKRNKSEGKRSDVKDKSDDTPIERIDKKPRDDSEDEEVFTHRKRSKPTVINSDDEDE